METSILFVEDNEDLRANATLVLGLEGYVVRAARDGLEALEILDNGFTPHLIVSDIMMPRMDGYEFFEAVRQKEHLKGIPFIFLTARGSRRDISTGRSLGADDYLVKPFDPEEFLIAVQNKLQRAAEMREQATESLNDARRLLVQVLSHELRTPLTYVTGGFALLAEELETEESTQEDDDVRISLDLIQSGTQRLSRLAEQMVLYSEIISGFVDQQVKTKAENLGLHYLIGDAIALNDVLAAEHNVAIKQTGPEEELTIHGLKDMLVVAFSEVLRNAIQYAPAESEVEIITTTKEGSAVVTISDHGPGVETEHQEHIWDVMIQPGREQNERPGVGMGLPIVKGIIEAHNGDAYLFSDPGKGTEVTLRIPLASLNEDNPAL